MALNITTCTKKKDGDCEVNYLKLLNLLFEIDDRRYRYLLTYLTYYLARHLSQECSYTHACMCMHNISNLSVKVFCKGFLHVDLEVDLSALSRSSLLQLQLLVLLSSLPIACLDQHPF